MKRERVSWAERVTHGALRGAIAAMAMTGLRAVTQNLGLVPTSPPEAVVEEGSQQNLTARLGAQGREIVVQAAHWGYGGVGGAIFGALPEEIRRRAWAGLAYGVVLWMGFETVIAPLLKLPREAKPAERAALLADHLLYGLVLSEIRRRPQR